jgi:hypothetical protein
MYNKILGMVNIYVLFRDNIPFYVGKTKNPKYRINDHKRTFGKDIEFVLIDQVKSSEWKFWEKYYISLFKTWGFKLENLNNGGGGPEVYLKETKLKMSLNRKGKGIGKNSKISEAKKGIARNITWGSKISQAKTGKPKQGKSILQIDPITHQTLNIFSSVTEARKILNNNGIPNALKGISKTSGGYIWRYKE